jgi:hypothetical protein
MRRVRTAAAIAMLALCSAAPTTPQRKAVLDALRPAIEAKLGANVEFVVQVLRVEGGWAFVIADPQRKGGKPIDGKSYFDDFDNMDGLRVDAVLQMRNGRWRLVEYAIGATDVWYCGVGPNSLKRDYGC